MSGNISRRMFLKAGVTAAGALALSNLIGSKAWAASAKSPAEVFFTDDISVDGLLKIYNRINRNISGKTAIKLHTGEPKGPNLLPIDLIKGLQATVPDSNIVECNVLYGGPRGSTKSHLETVKTNGFNFCPVDIMDADGELSLPIPGLKEFLADPANQGRFAPGNHLSEVAVGRNITKYNSMIVYTHFKGHSMGGFGGALKNISIGCASGRGGKRQIHGSGWPTGELFLERMVEGGLAITSHFGPRIVYLNVLKNISVDCDCESHPAKPTCPDIGIVGSTDILAVDQASVDLVYALPESERRDMVKRIESRKGLHQLEYMKALNMGSDQYQLIKI
jgi:Uncharacterized Fe-S center protein